MFDKTDIEEKPESISLNADEVRAEIDALSQSDKLKLGGIEMRWLGGTGLSKGDIVHEAVCRALAGKRKCPRGTSFMAFMVETMRSIASHAREEQRRIVVDTDGLETNLIGATAETRVQSPEEKLISSSTVQEIYGHFEDDEEATFVLMGWADGLRGQSLREATGLDQAKLDYAIKRIRTRMRTIYPNGWPQ